MLRWIQLLGAGVSPREMKIHRTNFPFEQVSQFPAHGHLPGAHHPHCPRHENHLIWLGSRPLCLGCTCIYTGMVLGVIAGVLIIHSSFTFIQLTLGVILTLVPTAVQPWYQRKTFKLAARTLLGNSVGVFIVILVSGFSLPNPVWGWRAGLLIVVIGLYRFLFWLRQSKPNDPCVNCPEGVYPVCEWNLANVCSATDNPKLLSAIEYQREEKPKVLLLGKDDSAKEIIGDGQE